MQKKDKVNIYCIFILFLKKNPVVSGRKKDSSDLTQPVMIGYSLSENQKTEARERKSEYHRIPGPLSMTI